VITIKDVARYIHFDWKTVKAFHKEYLKNKFTQGVTGNPHLLVVDEVAVKKHHHYLTIVLNWETGHVLFVGKERKCATLKTFFDS
jgi:hypothetical protein